jgi:DNA-binding protein H-NS
MKVHVKNISNQTYVIFKNYRIERMNNIHQIESLIVSSKKQTLDNRFQQIKQAENKFTKYSELENVTKEVSWNRIIKRDNHSREQRSDRAHNERDRQIFNDLKKCIENNQYFTKTMNENQNDFWDEFKSMSSI